MLLLTAAIVTLAGCSVTDGDTIRCGSERIRLLGIDAPELPGHCRRNRICAPGDPQRSKASLHAVIATGPVTMWRAGHDRYGRTLAAVSVSGVDLSCHQLRTSNAIYKRRWDTAGRIRATCPTLTLR